MGFYAPPPVITAEVFAAVPDRLSKSGHPLTWIDADHPGSRLGLTAQLPVAGVQLYSHQLG